MTPEQDLAWAAGYLDARGNIYFKSPSGQVVLIITDQDAEVLRRFSVIIGAGSLVPIPNRNTNRLQVSSRRDLTHLLTALRPLLTRRKLIADAEQALEQIAGREDKHG